jgi:aldehyde dehydrogenase (NAD+)
VCCAGSRLLVQESVAEEVLMRLKRRMGTLRVGDPLDKNTDIGAINSAEQLGRIRALARVGEEEGAGRWSPTCELPGRGFWFPPTLFTGVSGAHRIAREEIFGPVLSVLTFRTPAEAVEKANNTPYGLSAGVWTEKGSRILWMAQQLRAGVVWANTFNKFDPTSPFGGYQESGYGREGGRHGLAGYLQPVGQGAAQ